MFFKAKYAGEHSLKFQPSSSTLGIYDVLKIGGNSPGYTGSVNNAQ